MGHQVKLYEIRATIRRVELPDACPKCGCDLLKDGDLIVGQMTAETQSCHINEEGEIDDYGSAKSYPEAQYPQKYSCKWCNHELVAVPDDRIVNPDETPDVRRVISTHLKHNMQVLKEGFEMPRGVALLDCYDREEGKQATLLCAVYEQDSKSVDVAPVAVMIDGISPFKRYLPPSLSGSGYDTNPPVIDMHIESKETR